MPTSTNYKSRKNVYGSRNAYYNDRRLYANSSAAYDIPDQYTQRDTRVKQKKTGKSVKTGAFIRNKVKPLKLAVVAAAVVLVAFTMIYKQTAILEKNQELKKLEGELSALLSANQAMQTEIETALESGDIEERARKELGMMRPEPHQTFYIDMKLNDNGSEGSINKDSGGRISGTPGALVNAFRVLK